MHEVGPTLVATAPVPARLADRFDDLRGRDLNLVPLTFDEAATDPAWDVDHRRTVLGREPPGEPAPHGPYVLARQALVDYAFADPRLVRAVYDPTVPLEGRTMLLVGRFFGLRFPMGVRIGGVVDAPGEREGRPIHQFGWHYNTLQGHLERGQMRYELVKWADTGDVEARIDAYSQRGEVTNPVVRLGFAVFGRWMQRRFHARVLSRLHEVVAVASSP